MDKAVKDRFEEYPLNARIRLEELRELIFKLSSDLQLGEVEESLKWGEPSYNVKTGSPIRIDWKLKSPNNYYLYFHCQTKLIDTFRELHCGFKEIGQLNCAYPTRCQSLKLNIA
ncbi:hypothetical protein FB440_12112 [Vibrio crassostreae]|nr:hypothetical protein FB440_12112 [Vibrio crassostreae]